MKLNIITSYPKSGNTWMRYIIYELFFNPKNYENDNSLNIKKFIPDLHQIQLKNNQLILDENLKNKEIFIESHYSFDQMKNFPIDKLFFFSIMSSISANSIFSLGDKDFPIVVFPEPIIPVNTRFFFNVFTKFQFDLSQICLNF